MVDGQGNGTSKRRKPKKRRLKYFFLDGDLHRVIHITKGQDLLVAWSYPQRKRIGYIYSDVEKRKQNAYTLIEAARLLNRGRLRLQLAIMDGHVKRPQMSYKLDGSFKPVKYYLSEDDVLEFHDYFVTVHRGRPRKDGYIVTHNLPTRAELRAMMRHDTIFYVKNEDGEFVPTWKESIL